MSSSSLVSIASSEMRIFLPDDESGWVLPGLPYQVSREVVNVLQCHNVPYNGYEVDCWLSSPTTCAWASGTPAKVWMGLY